MASFYLNVRDGQTLIGDPEPYMFATLQSARDSAIQIVREMFNTHAADESLDDRRIEISDETGHPICFVQASDVRSTNAQLRQNSPAPLRELKS